MPEHDHGIERALRADAERLRMLATNLQATNLGPAMKDVRDAARLLDLAARKVEEADALPAPRH